MWKLSQPESLQNDGNEKRKPKPEKPKAKKRKQTRNKPELVGVA